jgi:heat shock protein HslJ
MMIILVIFLAGCSAAEETPLPEPVMETNLTGSEWHLVSLNGENLIVETAITLRFEEEFLGGEMVCNGYGGSMDSGKYIASTDGTFQLEFPLAVTVQYCEEPEGIMEQENVYITALMNAARFQITDDRLELLDETGKEILTYNRD